MYFSILLQAIIFVYTIILTFVYFFGKKNNYIENKIYKYILSFNVVLLFFAIIINYMINYCEDMENVVLLCSKIYYIILLIWIILATSYIMLSRCNNKYILFKEFFKQSVLSKVIVIIDTIIVIICSFLSVHYMNNPVYFYGNEILFVQWVGIIYSTVSLAFIFLYIKDIPKYKCWTFLISSCILAIILLITMNNNYLYIFECGISLISFLFYFTIENPNSKYIEELNSLRITAENANKEKTYFLASISHEIRTPLNAIIGLSETMMHENIPDSELDDIKNINKSGNILLGIVNSILDITKIEEGKTTINNVNYNIADVIGELTNVVNVLIEDKPIKFSVEVNGNIPNLINGDSTKIYQVLMNLLSNAVKYTQKGSIKFLITSSIFANNATFTFKVIDTGIGIKTEMKDKIFQKFERLGQEQKNIRGTGLGLFITKTLVEAMDGKISYESVYQSGTTFTVVINQKIVDKKTVADCNDFKSQKTKIDKYFDGSKYKILLVDDNSINLRVAQKILMQYKFNIQIAKSGVECLNMTKNNRYDLIFLDHMMPEMDGVQTLYYLKKRASGFDTPVIALTANAIEGSREMYIHNGFDDYISKPINQVELDNVLRVHLKINEE